MQAQSPDGGERTVLRLLAAGRVAEVAAVLSKDGRRDLVALVGVADARARGLAVDVPEVEAVVERIEREEPPDSRLRFWGYAMLAERLLLELDGTAFVVARHALDELDSAGFPARPPLALRYARARLTRVASLAWLLAPTPEALATHRELRDRAVAELLACNLVDEVHVSRGLAAGLSVAVAEEAILENYASLLDARAATDDDSGSMWPAVLDVFVAIVAFEAGDLKAALEAFDRLDRVPQLHTRVRGLIAFGRAFFRVITGGASAQTLAGVERALTEVRRHDPRIAQAWHGQLAQTLADMGEPAAAHFARLEAELPPVGPVHAMGRELLGLRIAALGGAPVDADRAIATLARLEAAGYRRRSGRQALRLAQDLARAGHVAPARPLHAWGRDRMPPGAQRTMWERWWLRPVEGSSAWERVPFAPVGPAPRSVGGDGDGGTGAGPGQPGLEVRVMAPALSLAVDGEPRALSATQAKLVVGLVAAHPVPLHVEQASDLLWPDEDAAATRYRLNSLVHRLRRTLGRYGPAIVRSGDLLEIDSARCEADLWRLRRALARGTPDRVRALVSVRGCLCDAQFPYEERFVDERHRLRGEWLRHARAATRAGEVGRAELAPVLSALELSPGDL